MTRAIRSPGVRFPSQGRTPFSFYRRVAAPKFFDTKDTKDTKMSALLLVCLVSLVSSLKDA
jgi:hypothetical protein